MTATRNAEAEARHDLARGASILVALNAIMRDAGTPVFQVVCRDGYEIRVRRPAECDGQTGEIRQVSVRVPPEDTDFLRDIWDEARCPARGLFHRVPVSELVSLVWLHHGVSLEESRKRALAGKEDA